MKGNLVRPWTEKYFNRRPLSLLRDSAGILPVGIIKQPIDREKDVRYDPKDESPTLEGRVKVGQSQVGRERSELLVDELRGADRVDPARGHVASENPRRVAGRGPLGIVRERRRLEAVEVHSAGRARCRRGGRAGCRDLGRRRRAWAIRRRCTRTF